MAMTIFYSWQSDRPTHTNKDFIESCLQQVIQEFKADVELQEAVRDEIGLDKDTLGVSGSPPIVETLFQKIDSCAVFVPDLTFVATARNQSRPMPNTNVTVEYGYAIKAVGYARIVSLMNTAYGKPRSDDGREFLPFDMRHLREPITYCLEEKPDAGELRTVKEQLVRDLKLAIRDVIRDKLASMEWSFHEFFPPEKPSRFLRSDEKLTQEMDDLKNRSIDIHLRDSSDVFLRVQPRAIFAPRPHNEVRQIACASIPPFLKPSMASGSCNWGRNRYGFVFHNGPIRGSEATKVVQIFTTGEIWAINASFLDQDGPILPFETMFETALTAYRDFLVREFGVDPPFRFIVGMTGLEGRNLVLADPPPGMRLTRASVGPCVQDEVICEGVLGSEDAVSGALRPFFDQVYGTCGIGRPDWYGEITAR